MWGRGIYFVELVPPTLLMKIIFTDFLGKSKIWKTGNFNPLFLPFSPKIHLFPLFQQQKTTLQTCWKKKYFKGGGDNFSGKCIPLVWGNLVRSRCWYFIVVSASIYDIKLTVGMDRYQTSQGLFSDHALN